MRVRTGRFPKREHTTFSRIYIKMRKQERKSV